MKDFGALMEEAQKRCWNLCLLDVNVDLSTPQGELMASIMASTSHWERRIIGARTADALSALKAKGATLGRPRTVSDQVVAFIAPAQRNGGTWSSLHATSPRPECPQQRVRPSGTRTVSGQWHSAGA
jgi:DNA invertase Pin-like site-specific DNA recombinase